jgi:hypothetical protein
MQSRKNKKTARRRNQRKANTFSGTQSGTPQRTGHSFSRVGEIMPSEIDVMLPYTATYNFTNSAALYANRPIYSNSAYDVDPALGSTSTQGFAEWAAFYFYYRVIGYRYEIEVNNGNNIPMIFTILNSNTLNGLSSGYTYTTDLSAFSNNPHAQSKLMGHAYNTSATHIFRKQILLSDVVGSLAPETEDNYRALTAASPSDLTYILMGVTSSEGGTNYLANTVSVVVRLNMDVRFYNRKQLSS